ncbi:flagellar FlbD family protein [Enterococcus alcedinis]|uniref:Flagellar FlbD family protein n=1 Tax=Enterococcus alcedinis TaxID=1274384 RepID=A0A917N6T4_9ENTE|nr:flagellar FlbD family protein [Enterococcus alcedinis]MBP2102598.1 flagellar protein FlbD [Enterococcus alcedinis]GGI66157.1 flagellar FlbD family protein [Enterococcus alcedinis]
MIAVTTLHGKNFYINPDLIYRIEETPDTTITLIDSKTIVVKEAPEVVVHRIISYRQTIYRQVPQINKNQ